MHCTCMYMYIYIYTCMYMHVYINIIMYMYMYTWGEGIRMLDRSPCSSVHVHVVQSDQYYQADCDEATSCMQCVCRENTYSSICNQQNFHQRCLTNFKGSFTMHFLIVCTVLLTWMPIVNFLVNACIIHVYTTYIMHACIYLHVYNTF